MIPTLDKPSLNRLANRLAKRDPRLQLALEIGGPPKLWKRTPNFATFVRIILEQQVSLASAWSTFNRLKSEVTRITPSTVMPLHESGLRDLGFSRQKARYTYALATDCLSRRFVIGRLPKMDDAEVREAVTARLGLGQWSADVFMLLALGRHDVLPLGDYALVKGWSELCDDATFDLGTAKNHLSDAAEEWRPYRSVATRMVWAYYLHRRGNSLPGA